MASRPKRAPLPGFVDQQPAVEQKPLDDHPGRAGQTMVGFYLGKAAHRQLKQLALNKDSTQQDLLTKALNMLFEKEGMPPIA